MAKTWDHYVVFCGGKDGCDSLNVNQLEDENNHLWDYQVFECLNCGRILKIELPN
jgi:hypothetical protein